MADAQRSRLDAFLRALQAGIRDGMRLNGEECAILYSILSETVNTNAAPQVPTSASLGAQGEGAASRIEHGEPLSPATAIASPAGAAPTDKNLEGNCPHCGFPCDRFEPTCSSPGFHAPDRRVEDRRSTRSAERRNEAGAKLTVSLNMHARHAEDARLGLSASQGHVCSARQALDGIKQRAEQTMKDCAEWRSMPSHVVKGEPEISNITDEDVRAYVKSLNGMATPWAAGCAAMLVAMWSDRVELLRRGEA